MNCANLQIFHSFPKILVSSLQISQFSESKEVSLTSSNAKGGSGCPSVQIKMYRLPQSISVFGN